VPGHVLETWWITGTRVVDSCPAELPRAQILRPLRGAHPAVLDGECRIDQRFALDPISFEDINGGGTPIKEPGGSRARVPAPM
jgi:hypothetical protein